MNLKKFIPDGSMVLMGLGVLAGAKLVSKAAERFMPRAAAPSAYKLPVKSQAYDDLVIVQ